MACVGILMSTETLKTATGAHHVIERGDFGRKVTDEALRLYRSHDAEPNARVPVELRKAAERIVQLEEALRARDNTIVEVHEELRLCREEADAHKAEAAYWEGKATDGAS
jgi:hypothetical protein